LTTMHYSRVTSKPSAREPGARSWRRDPDELCE
jgi:hypothetical protein